MIRIYFSKKKMRNHITLGILTKNMCIHMYIKKENKQIIIKK